MNDKNSVPQGLSVEQIASFVEKARAAKEGDSDKVKVSKWETTYDKAKRSLQSSAVVDPLDAEQRIAMLMVVITSADKKTFYAAGSALPELKNVALGAAGSGIGGLTQTGLFDPATHGSDVVAVLGGFIKKKEGGMEEFFLEKKIKL